MPERTHDPTFTVTTLKSGSVSVPSLQVHVTGPQGADLMTPLGIAPLVIGAQIDCDIVLDDPHVSRNHCSVTLTDDGVLLKDLGSKNGTYIGELEIREAFLQPGVLARIGNWRLSVRVTGAPQEVALSKSARFGEAVGGSLVMRALFARLEVAAATHETVLLIGESGTGKELLARAIHDASPRRNGPFAVFDCSGVAASLVEAELFGFVRGAFTGADRDRAGIFEQAHGGTLFIDEIGELPLDLQPKLLRALEARQTRRVGANAYTPFDARIVAATHRNLGANVSAGTFREDLYYRLAVLQARVPPLRERRDDVELLAEQFLAARLPPLTLHDLPPGSREMLRTHEWPGNVRELRNVLARMIVFQDEIHLDAGGGVSGGASDGGSHRPDALLKLPLREARQQVIERFEETYINAQLAANAGNVTRAAEAAGVSRQFLHRLIERYRLRGEGE